MSIKTFSGYMTNGSYADDTEDAKTRPITRH